MKEIVIGLLMIGLFVGGMVVIAGPAGTERVAGDPGAFLVLFAVAAICVLCAVPLQKKSMQAAQAAKVPGAGCGAFLAMAAVIVVVVLFFALGVAATLGGG